MKRNTEKLPSPWVSAIPLAVLTLLLYVVIRAFGGGAIDGGSQIALLSATSVCVMLSIGIYRCRWAVLEEAIIDNIRASASAIVRAITTPFPAASPSYFSTAGRGRPCT